MRKFNFQEYNVNKYHILPLFYKADSAAAYLDLYTNQTQTFNGAKVINQDWFSHGFLSQGFLSAGVISHGIFSIGVLSQGVFSIGLFSRGVVSMGLFSMSPSLNGKNKVNKQLLFILINMIVFYVFPPNTLVTENYRAACVLMTTFGLILY